jgi:hypothetical protein
VLAHGIHIQSQKYGDLPGWKPDRREYSIFVSPNLASHSYKHSNMFRSTLCEFINCALYFVEPFTDFYLQSMPLCSSSLRPRILARRGDHQGDTGVNLYVYNPGFPALPAIL